ncbi:winged helix DNA-binding domain-containing protein [Nonomuraea sp. 10N515B]|uniref:winged helix DNA-binding domain-containing protein n=1 Tax=Nonomuraea sp. 10N515B TaxID=3457422 RepID=UPI003FCCC3CB
MRERAGESGPHAFGIVAPGRQGRAGACAIQNSPPGSALLALHARVADVTSEEVAQAIEADKTLLQTWCMRGAPFLFPTQDAPVFTMGVLPDGETSRRRFILGVEQALATLGMSLDEAVERTERELEAVLSERRLAIDELGARLSARIVRHLPPEQALVWQAEGPYAAGQPWGEGVVHFALRIVALKGALCFAPRSGNKAPFVLTAEWLGEPPPDPDPQAARAELARRYLRCYGPSTPKGFAAWTGLTAGDVPHRWRLIEDELAEVDLDGRPAWLLASDLDALRSAEAVRGVRLLPPRDPYIQTADRLRLVPDKGLHRRIWRTTGEPGTVLAEGRLVATWRQRKEGMRLRIEVEPLAAPPGSAARDLIEAEAEAIAVLRGASGCRVRFTGT